MHRGRIVSILLLAGVLLATGACSDDDDDDDAATGDVAAFCGELERLGGERPEGYVGSEEHLADVDALAEAAPPDIRPAVVTYRDFLGTGAVDPNDPDSSLTESWPTEIQNVVTEILDYETTNC